MDTIAADAGVSKLTAYNHFGNKAALFAEVIERKCHDMLGAIDFGAAGAVDARSSLIAVGNAFVRLVTSPDAMGAHNVIVQERERAPELGPMFYNSAVLNSARRVAALLSELHRRGDVRIGDPEQSARDILSLWRAQPTMHIELGIQRFTDKELDAHVARITDLFLKAWQ
jgi:TetR/AcrR family transcriptional repressor of mexJK operon